MLGGSFNPAHRGHLHIARLALRRLRLDQVWLMVSPGNPLKPARGMAPMQDRLDSARSIADGRRIVATYDTLRALRLRFPLVQFVWLMGADNLVQLPRWQHWTGIAATMPFAVMPRPTYNQRALSGQAARRLRPHLLPSRQAPLLAALPSPAWTFLPAKQDPTSATAIRESAGSDPRRAWPPPKAAPISAATPRQLHATPVLATSRA